MSNAEISSELMGHFEGLVRKTAGKLLRTIREQQNQAGYENFVEEDFDDVCQFLRYKVWKALLAFDPVNLRKKPSGPQGLQEARDKYVFSCIVNAKVDVLKKKRHNLLFIESIAPTTPNSEDTTRDRFEQRYLCEDPFGDLDLDDAMPLPSTLTESERAVVLLLYLGFKPAEIALRTTLPRSEITSIVETICSKMADWNPGVVQPAPVPLAA